MEKLTLEEKKKMFSLFINMKDELKAAGTNPVLNREKNSEVLIVDGYNTFIRCFSAIPTMNTDGIHTGGVAGFLKSIGYAIKLLKPTRCVIIFDGKGGSKRRKSIYPDYKENKHSGIRLNRIYDEISDLQDEEKNMKIQIYRMLKYIEVLPVSMLSIDNVEADDTIAYCANQYFKNNSIIMSSDKDFLQLVNDRIRVWSPTKKKFYGKTEIYSEFQIHPCNFCLFRALDGDNSDNIPGIKGFGLKTAIKAFPMLSEDRKVTVDEMYNHATTNREKLKAHYSTFLDNKESFERNISLMQLADTYLTVQSQLHINEVLDGPVNKMNRYGFTKLITEDKMWANIGNHQVWLTEVFGPMDTISG